MARNLSLLAFLLISLAVWWSITTNTQQDMDGGILTEGDYVEVFMNNFEITRMSEHGQPQYVMHGKHLEKFADKDETHIDGPVFELIQENHWKIVARNAVMDHTAETVELIDDVIMTRLESVPALTVYTDRIHIDTRNQIASTESPVKVVQGESELNALGMIYNNTTSVMELTQHVRGTFQPDK